MSVHVGLQYVYKHAKGIKDESEKKTVVDTVKAEDDGFVTSEGVSHWLRPTGSVLVEQLYHHTLVVILLVRYI